ncbi:MAG: DUF1295 domain-containing protein [Polyangiales bacterium]
MTLSSLSLAALVYVAFVLLLFVGSLVLPGRSQAGPVLPNGQRPHYRLNGLLLFVLLLAGLGLGWRLDWFSPSWVAHNFWSLFVVANVFSFAWTAQLFWQGRRGRSDSLARDLWYGVSYNPTWLGVDLKLFAYRPSLMGLGLINAAFAAQQIEETGSLSLAMGLYQALTLFYLLSTYEYEAGLLTMWDMIEEKFGFMLVWGDLVFVPFFYCIPGYFLLSRPEPIHPAAAAALVLLFALGFWMFRGTNAQKNRFKRNPDAKIWGRKPETIDGRLLVSGFWGLGRKLNYSGEILMYLSFTALNGLHAFWPYLLPLWLASLLVHRAHRDDKRCHSKYGALWERYCQRVRFRMLPFVY